jgi:predicted enzyme related to lactoylglutathione lyase
MDQKEDSKMSMTIHFEIPADDLNRAKSFYNKLFGWEIYESPGRKNYLLIKFNGEKRISSSIIKRFSPRQTTIIYFDVPSVEEYSAKIQELGGKIVVPKKPVPGIGYFAICHDTENNNFGIWEEDSHAK